MCNVETNLSVTPSTIRISGDVTIYHAVATYRCLRPLIEANADWEVDMSGVAEIDTAGIQVLLACKRLSHQCGSRFRVVNHSKAVIDALDSMNLAGRFGDPIVIEATR